MATIVKSKDASPQAKEQGAYGVIFGCTSMNSIYAAHSSGVYDVVISVEPKVDLENKVLFLYLTKSGDSEGRGRYFRLGLITEALTLKDPSLDWAPAEEGNSSKWLFRVKFAPLRDLAEVDHLSGRFGQNFTYAYNETK